MQAVDDGGAFPPAKPDDLSFDVAVSAHRHTSHVPEKRAQTEQQAYADDVNGLHAELLPIATTEAQQAILLEEIERYRKGYLDKIGAYLRSRSLVASSMITGPANFPVRRNQKANAAADNKRTEFLEWRERARAAIRRKLLEALTPEEKEGEEWRALASKFRYILATIEAIDASASPYTRRLFVNGITGRVERLALNGEVALVDKSLELVREYNGTHKKPAISARHKFWDFGNVARSAAQRHDATLEKESEVVAESNGVRIVANHQADRVQIVFPAKPAFATIAALKKEGWRWSPSEGAWQRKLTDAAKSSAIRLIQDAARQDGLVNRFVPAV